MVMDIDTYYEAAYVMRDIGGSFVSTLAELFFLADPMNKRKILNAFRDIFDEYKKKAKAWKD